MKSLRSLIAAAFLAALSSGPALAACTGVFPSNTICGTGGSPAIPSPLTVIPSPLLATALPSLTTSQIYGGSGGAGVAQHFPAGTGVETALQVNVGLAGAFITFNGAGGTPSSINLSNATSLPAATTSTLGAVSTDGATIANSSGAISCRTATSSLLGCASFGTGLSVTAGAVTPAFGTATNQVAEGGVITAGGPTGSATAVPVITYNAAGQLTAVSTAALGTAAADNTGTSGATIPLNNGGFTQSGAAIFSSTLAETDSALPAMAAGTLGLAGGNTSNPTLGANDEGAMYLTTVNGLTNIGKGSTYDTALLDSAGGVALGVQTGTLNLTFGGGVTAASLATPSSNIGGALCATTGGVFLYNVGANCYAGGGSAGGSNTQVQWNSTGSLGGIIGATTNGTILTLTKSDFALAGSSTGVTTLNSGLAGAGNNTLTLPITATDTLAALGTAETFSALQTFATSDLAINGGTATAGLATVTSGGVVSSEAQATLAQGGTAASLTASNGGVVYSGASAFAVLAGTATASQCLLSGSNAAPTWGACPGGTVTHATFNGLTATPTGPSSSSAFTMQGLAGAITPASSGIVLVSVTATANTNATGLGAGIQCKIYFGTGTAPTNGAALAGTQVGSTVKYTNPIAGTTAVDNNVPMSLSYVLTGLTPSTAYWVDLACEGILSTTAQLLQVNVSLGEL